MKKIKAIFLVAAMLFALSACGTQGTEAQSETIAQSIIEEQKSQIPAKDTEWNEQAAEQSEAQAEASAEPITIRVGVPKSPPTLPILYMMEKQTLGENVTIELDIWDAPEQLIAMVQDGKHDMYAFPLTVVAKLFNKGLDVRLMNVNTWGVTYFVTTDENLTSWEQLKGKTVYIPLQSSPPDALTQFFLNEAGLAVGKDVELVYGSTAEIGQMMAAGRIEYATLIEPQVTSAKINNEKVRVAFSFEEEWKKAAGDSSIVPNAGFGTTQKFIDANPELAAQFNAAYEEALNWVVENPDEAAALAEIHLGLKAKVVEKAIPNMGLLFKNGVNAKEELDGYYQLLVDFEPTMIGGKVPDETMYYAE